jgi:hypothetical protein
MGEKRGVRRALSLAVRFSLLALASCGGHTLNVGSMSDGSAATALGRDAGADAPLGPVWNGVLENAQLPDGSNRLTMTLSVAQDGTAIGTLLLGDGALLRPPTDPAVGYPPGAQFPVPGGPLGFFEGFAYTILDGRMTGSRLTFRVAEFELWTQWCKLQTTTYAWPGILDADGGVVYSCVPNGSNGQGPTGCSQFDPVAMKDVPSDCGKSELCENSPCDCSATGCRVRSATKPDLAFNLVVTDASADGTITGGLGDHAVHFSRAP